MNRSTPGLPVHHQLPEFTQTHVHLNRWCHPTISSSVVPSPSVFNLSQHQGLFKWDSSSYQVAKVLEFQLTHQSFQWIYRTFRLTGLTSWQSKGLSRVFSNTTLQNHQFFNAQLSLWSNSHISLEKGMANHFSVLALRTPWTVWKGILLTSCK